jgi:hypothetical protein
MTKLVIDLKHEHWNGNDCSTSTCALKRCLAKKFEGYLQSGIRWDKRGVHRVKAGVKRNMIR